MEHRFKQRVYENGMMLTKNFTVNALLSSGLTDCNGKEIFEGDKVKVAVSECETKEYTVEFVDGVFYAGGIPIRDIATLDIEVIG